MSQHFPHKFINNSVSNNDLSYFLHALSTITKYKVYLLIALLNDNLCNEVNHYLHLKDNTTKKKRDYYNIGNIRLNNN